MLVSSFPTSSSHNPTRASDAPPAATPPVPSHARRIRRHPRWVYVAVAIATAGWLVLQLAAGVRQNDHAYPVTGYAMFSHPSDGVDVRLELVGTSTEAARIDIHAADLGLTELQLRAYLARNAGTAVTDAVPDAAERLGELAEVWSDRQGATLEGLMLVRVERSLDNDTPRVEEVSTWRR